MDLSGIISIAGKPGLYRLVAQTKNGIIVENVQDGKRFPAYASHRVSALEDISIYTYDDDIPLGTVYQSIYDKENGGEALNHKSSGDELRAYMQDILPDFDEERVYTSDIKKLLSWYNLLHSAGALKLKEEAEEETVEEAQATDAATEETTEEAAEAPAATEEAEEDSEENPEAAE